MRKIAIAAVLCGSLLAAPAMANPGTNEIIVSTTTRSGGEVKQMAAVESELREAARVVCSEGRVHRGPMSYRGQTCYRKAMLDARKQLAEIDQRRAMRQGG